MSENDPVSDGPKPTCPRCGSDLPEKAPGGLCPRCLMAEAMAPTEAAEDSESNPRPDPPDIETVQAAFPQLEIIEIIGVGGMGVVYKARQTSLNRLVALKLLAPHREKEPGFADRFTREARALAVLDHPNIVTVHDFGQAGGFFYLLMEFIDGVNLRQAMQAGRFTPDQALAVVPPICEALQFAHDRGVVHRDIKPENLLLNKEGRVKVADFGIARILDQGELGREPLKTEPDQFEPDLTAGTALGTPKYMAPEQANHPEQVDHRADIYSLGVVIYEMLTGEPPSGPLAPPSSRVEIDVRLDEVVLRALADSPELRWQTATDLRTQVETIVASDPDPPTEPATTAVVPAPSNEKKGKPWLWVSLLLGAIALPFVILGGYLLLLVLQDPSWNPHPQELLVTSGIWGTALLLSGGALFSFTRWTLGLPPKSRKRSLFGAIGLALAFLVLAIPLGLIGSRIKADTRLQVQSYARAADLEQEWHRELDVAQSNSEQLAQLRNRYQSRESLEDRDKINRLIQQLEADGAGSQQRSSAAGHPRE